MMIENYETTYQLDRESEDGEHSTTYTLTVDYGIEPAEYEGRHLFYAGGVYINFVKDAEGKDFTLSDEEEQELLCHLTENTFIPAHYYPADY